MSFFLLLFSIVVVFKVQQHIATYYAEKKVAPYIRSDSIIRENSAPIGAFQTYWRTHTQNAFYTCQHIFYSKKIVAFHSPISLTTELLINVCAGSR